MAVYSGFENMHRDIDIRLWIDDKNRLWVMWTHSPYYPESIPASIKTPFAFDYHNGYLSCLGNQFKALGKTTLSIAA